MSKKVYNFNAGPAILPKSALEQAQKELLDYQGAGLSVMEMSHRSKEYDGIIKSAEQRVRRLLNITDDYYVLFLQGGASTQFATIPMNLLTQGKNADYINTGAWSKKAIKEAEGIASKTSSKINVIASGEADGFSKIPNIDNLKINNDSRYVHFTSNNTIYGTQWAKFPETGNIPCICDMSSDIMCKPIDIKKFKMIYAGAQKNIGPSGTTLVIIHKELVESGAEDIPAIFQYRTHVKNPSLYNTPSCYPIYMVDLTLKWLEEEIGGLEKMEKINIEKSNIIYDYMDSTDFYKPAVTDKNSRSWMNVTFRIKKEDLEPKFIEEAKNNGMIGLKGHRSVGGCRASIYNAHPIEGVKALVEFMKKFEKENK